MSEFKRLILIDMDTVIEHCDGDINEIPLAKFEAKSFLWQLSQIGLVKFYSSLKYDVIKAWLKANEFDSYQIVNKLSGAYLTIDGKCICYEGDFSYTYEQIRRYKAHYKL